MVLLDGEVEKINVPIEENSKNVPGLIIQSFYIKNIYHFTYFY
jgi:hypothetical protein